MEIARGVENGKYSAGFRLRQHPDELARPLTWRKPQMIFVNSMSDMFHRSVSLDFILEVFQVMDAALARLPDTNKALRNSAAVFLALELDG